MNLCPPIVSVGVATFNAERFILATLKSVFAQTVADFELIAIDDGSTDATVSLLRGISDPRLRLFSDGLNKGTAVRYNEIVERASAPVVAILDHDDLMHPLRLETQLKYLRDNPDVDAVGSSAYVIDEGGNLIGIRRQTEVPSSLRGVLSNGLLCHPSMTARRDWLSGHPYGTSLRRLADYDLWCRVWKDSKIGVISTPLIYYRDITFQSPRRYLRSYSEKIRLLARYGYHNAPIWTALCMIRQIAIISLYCLFYLSGNLRVVRSLQQEVPSEAEEKCAQSGLHWIAAQ